MSPLPMAGGVRVPREALTGLLRKTIEADGPIPFDHFMEVALYHPEYGYYAGVEAAVRAGPRGDFLTAPTLTPYFGRALARFVAAAWERLGQPGRWRLVEAGAGTGALALPLVDALLAEHQDAARCMTLVCIDAHAGHRAMMTQALAGKLPDQRVEVHAALPMGAESPTILLANELLDNLPVRLLRRSGGRWKERCVAVHRGGFTWTEVPAPASLAVWADAFGIPVPDDHVVEVPVGARKWLEAATASLGSAPAVALFIDYGETARDLLGEPRRHGTLMSYAGHEQDRDVLSAPGTRDITAHVNWTAFAADARGFGWNVLGYTTQSALLADLGLLEIAGELASRVRDPDAFAAYQGLKEVLVPGGLGERFKALALSHNVTGAADARWLGFHDNRPLDPPPRRR